LKRANIIDTNRLTARFIKLSQYQRKLTIRFSSKTSNSSLCWRGFTYR